MTTPRTIISANINTYDVDVFLSRHGTLVVFITTTEGDVIRQFLACDFNIRTECAHLVNIDSVRAMVAEAKARLRAEEDKRLEGVDFLALLAE